MEKELQKSKGPKKFQLKVVKTRMSAGYFATENVDNPPNTNKLRLVTPEMRSIRENLNTRKRNFSDLSDSFITLRRDENMPETEWNSIQRSKFRQCCDSLAGIAQDEINYWCSWEKNIKSVSERGEFKQSELDEMESFISARKSRAQKVHVPLGGFRDSLEGEWMRKAQFNDSVTQQDMAYLELLVDRFQIPYVGTEHPSISRTQQEQDRFRTDLLESHNARDEFSNLWCCISRKWMPFVTAAHISGYNLGHAQACYLFGKPPPGEDHLMEI